MSYESWTKESDSTPKADVEYEAWKQDSLVVENLSPFINKASEESGRMAQDYLKMATDLDLSIETVEDNSDELFGVADPIEMPKEEPYRPLQFSAAPEINDLMETIFGYEGAAKPDTYWNMNPIKKAAFDTYMASRHLMTRVAGGAAKELGVAKTKDINDLYNDELVNNPRWYQKSPEALGFTAAFAAEVWAMNGLWVASGLKKLFALERVAATKIMPFLTKEIVKNGGTQTLKTLSKNGLKKLGKDTVVKFLLNAPENVAMLSTWFAGKAAISKPQFEGDQEELINVLGQYDASIAEAMGYSDELTQDRDNAESPEIIQAKQEVQEYIAKAIKERDTLQEQQKTYGESVADAGIAGALWGLGFSAFAPVIGAVGKITMATPSGIKLHAVANEAYTSLWLNHPRLMNMGRRPFSDEFIAEAKRVFKKQFGYEPSLAEEAQLSKITRVVGEEISKKVQYQEALNRYWNYGQKASSGVATTPLTTSALSEKPPVTPVKPVTPAKPAITKPQPVKGVEGKVEPSKLSNEDFSKVYREYGKITEKAEKNQLRAMTPEERALWDDGKNWEEFSRKQGYSEKEIDDFKYWAELNQDARAESARGFEDLSEPERTQAKLAATKKEEADFAKLTQPAQGKVEQFIEGIKKPSTGPHMGSGKLDVSGVTEGVGEIIKNGVDYVKETSRTFKEFIDSLTFYPNTPLEFRNAVRTEVVGAAGQAGHRVYGQLSPSVVGNLGRDEIEQAAQIFYAKDEIARTKAGKGNPDMTPEQVQAKYDELVSTATPDILKTVENLDKVQKAYTDVLIERGLVDESMLSDDYARHYVVDYTPDWSFRRGLPPLKLKTPYRGYTKKATGTKKEYHRTMESILFSFYEKELDNIVSDFIEKQTSKYNILSKLSKAKRIEIFGMNSRGASNKPKPGRIVDIDGKRYRSYSPDAPFSRNFYQNENGETVIGGLKNISLIPEDIYNSFTQFSQRGGAIVSRINQVTRMWKSMAILSHYTGFTINNLVGDTLIALMQHPLPHKLVSSYPKALAYLAGKEGTKFYKDLDEFITKNDIVKGMLTTTELASFKNTANPLSSIMNALQEFSEKREAVNRIAYAISLLELQQSGRGKELIDAHNWVDTKGLDELSALGKIARDVEVDYKWVSKSWARYISGAVAPFGTWYFKMSANVWKWMSKHWGKALMTFLAAPVASTLYNDRNEKSRELEKNLPDYARDRVHFVLGESNGKTRVLALQLPQDALIGTKVFTIATAHVNRVILGEMTAKEASVATLKQWGYKETSGTASLMAPLGRFIWGLASADRRDPYDKSPIYSKDPSNLTAWEYKKQTALYGIKCSTPFLSAHIAAYEKGMPQSSGWKQSIDQLVGKRAFGIYDITPNTEIEITLENGEKLTLGWDDYIKSEHISKQTDMRLDRIGEAFAKSGLMPDDFAKSKKSQKLILDIHKYWTKFQPNLNEGSSNKYKINFVAKKLGERMANQIYSPGTLSRWYKIRQDKAKTNEEKTKLELEYQNLLRVKLEETLKSQPKTSIGALMQLKLQGSEIPIELLWELP